MISQFKHTLLKKNYSRAIPGNCLYLDVETRTAIEEGYEKHRLKLAWTCYVRYRQNLTVDRESWRYWESTYKLNKYIESQARQDNPLTLFGHNVFFDLQASDFFHYFTKWGWMLDFYYEQQLSYILVIKKEKRTIKVLSTTNYFPFSLKEIGNLVDLPKLDVDFGNVSDDDLSVYCRRDVEITRKSIEKYFEFIRDHDLGKFSPTRASQAFRAYRHRFMNTKIYLHDNKEIKNFERLAYYGGRTECFEIGEIKGGPFVTLDVNSMYPFVMIHIPVPCQLITYKENVNMDMIHATVNRFATVAEIEVRTDVPIYPYREKEKIIFPVGNFTTFVCTEGLREALNRGHLKRINRLAVYRKAIIFRDYVNYLYELRQQYQRENNRIMDTLCKILLNSLYGKFGQKKPATVFKDDITFDGYYRQVVEVFPKGVTGIEYKMFNTLVWQVGLEEAPKSFPAISAHITEAARMLLWRIIESTGRDRIPYCDTDSIKIRKRDLKHVKYPIDKTRLGALKIEGETKYLTIFGAKSYVTEKERKIKGVPHSAEEIEKNIFKYQEFLKQSSHLHKQVTRFFLVKDTIKAAVPFYDKGIVQDNGKVTPFRL